MRMRDWIIDHGSDLKSITDRDHRNFGTAIKPRIHDRIADASAHIHLCPPLFESAFDIRTGVRRQPYRPDERQASLTSMRVPSQREITIACSFVKERG